MLKRCPQCNRLSIEYDPYHRIEKCLNKECGWVNREKKALEESPDSDMPTVGLSAILEVRNQRTIILKA
jgi:hypothetical protein